MLHFGQKPPFDFKRFLEMCAELIPQVDLETLRSLPKPEDYSDKDIKEPAVLVWVNFDTALRNELVKARATHRRIDGSKYLRGETFTEPQLAQVALASYRNSALLEGEKMLDRLRWNFLDELCFGHYFDLNFLIIYAYKLMMLERWERFRLADKITLLEAVLANK